MPQVPPNSFNPHWPTLPTSPPSPTTSGPQSKFEKRIAELNKNLRSVGKIGQAFAINNAILREQADQEKAEKKKKDLLKSAITKLTAALNLSVAGQFVAGIKEFDTTQRAALGMNQTLATIIGENNQFLADLPGGYKDAVITQVEAFRSGFKAPNKNLIALGNRMKITGQSFQLLFSSMAQLRVAGLLNNKAVGRLSKHLNATTEKYGISTEILVGAMSKLGATLETTAALGTTEKIVGMQSDLIGLLGAGSEGLVTSVLQGLTKADIGADVAASLAGPAAAELRDAATNLGDLDTDTFFSLFEKVNKELGGFRRSFVGEGKLRAANLGWWTQIMGEGNLKLSLLAEKIDNLTDAEKETFKKSQELSKSLGTLREEILEPILELGRKTVTFASEHTLATKTLIGAVLALTAVIKMNTLATRLKTIGKGSAGAGALAAVGGPWGLGIAATAVIGSALFMTYTENKRQTQIAEENKRANERSAKFAKNREDRENISSSKFASMSSSTLRTVLQMQAFMPEFATSVANNMNQQNQKEIIHQLTLARLAMDRVAGNTGD